MKRLLLAPLCLTLLSSCSYIASVNPFSGPIKTIECKSLYSDGSGGIVDFEYLGLSNNGNQLTFNNKTGQIYYYDDLMEELYLFTKDNDDNMTYDYDSNIRNNNLKIVEYTSDLFSDVLGEEQEVNQIWRINLTTLKGSSKFSKYQPKLKCKYIKNPSTKVNLFKARSLKLKEP